MNDKTLYSCKKAEKSASQLGTIIYVIVSIPVICMGLYMVLKGFVFSDENFLNLSIWVMFGRIFNLFTIPIYLFIYIWNKILIIPFIYDFFGTEIVSISNNSLTIDRHALFLHKTKVINISDIIEVSHTNNQKRPPYVHYTCQNNYNVTITYYNKHPRRKCLFLCGLNFSAEEYFKFSSTLQNLIFKSKNNNNTIQ